VQFRVDLDVRGHQSVDFLDELPVGLVGSLTHDAAVAHVTLEQQREVGVLLLV